MKGIESLELIGRIVKESELNGDIDGGVEEIEIVDWKMWLMMEDLWVERI